MAFHVYGAHTDGDAMVYFMQNNISHMGDISISKAYDKKFSTTYGQKK